MSKRQKKPKAGYQKSKTRKKINVGVGGSSSKGAMTGLRGMFKRTVQGSPDKGRPSLLSRIVDALLWVAILGAIVYFIASAKCGK